MMAVLEEERTFFPVTSLEAFVNVIECYLKKNDDPNLAFLSVLFGYLEHELTVNHDSVHESPITGARSPTSPKRRRPCLRGKSNTKNFPVLHLDIIEGLLELFDLTLKAQVDKSLIEFTTRSGYATKKLCKLVSDIIWNGLMKSYHKDKAHIQSLFSYLTGKQLDCFGLAFVVVSACQVLNYNDVHLVVSGDHAWVSYGEDSKEEVEVTWHGKGTEDRRGFTVDQSLSEKNWIYHGGKAVKCNRWMEVAALVMSLNPSIDIHTDSEELQWIQHHFLQFLYQRNHLAKYPMALGMCCELEETVNGDVLSLTKLENIHDKALSVVQTLYNDLHVLPYCSKGHFCLRHGHYREAIQFYAKAAKVVSKYNYGKEDEEIYKEMIDIANDLIPQALKEDASLCDDPECYYDVIQFYDGICLWEEDSCTPVLHSWWARYFTTAVNKFSPDVRESFRANDSEETASSNSSSEKEGDHIQSPQSSRNKNVSTDSLCSSSETTAKVRLPVSKLHLSSEKMIGLKRLLTNGKKISSQAVGLILTAQSQVHFVKRRSNIGDYSLEYTNSKRVRRPKELDY